ncbi:MAG TPA: TIGR01212 family radical SAM protein [Candidatus Goldiibacteriota bacterium]|nr:TIGR01212 family radical SAM protein [Candidatus Goldiibacteriota bacterium]
MGAKKLPYLSLNEYFRNKFKKRVQRITVSLPFKCPHGACSYCLDGSAPHDSGTFVPLKRQIEDGIINARRRYGKDTAFFVYFQSYTNTNDTAENLKKHFDSVLDYSDVIGISVGTRPDCVPPEIIRLLMSYAEKGVETWVELGLQSANDDTLKKVNRGHTAAQFSEAVRDLKKAGLFVMCHMIAGFPWETREDVLKTAKLAASSGCDAIKIHPLHLLSGTPLADQYRREDFRLLGLDEYVKLLADIIEILPPEIVVARFTAEGRKDRLIAPDYCSPHFKPVIKQMLIDEMTQRGSSQGCRSKG